MPEHTIARYVDVEISTEDCSIAVIKQKEPLVHGDCNVLRLKLTDTPPDGALICVRYVNMATRNCYNDIYREITNGMEIAIPNNEELFFKCQSIKISFSIEANGCKKSSPSPADIQIIPLARVQEYAGETTIKLISDVYAAGEAAQDAADKANAVLKEIENNGGLLSSEQIGEAINNYLENNPLKESDPTVPDWAKQKDKPEYTADEVGAVSTDDLQNAVNTALTQAKASGEFDGADGADGEKGEKGDKGDTGEQGKAGANGFSPNVTVTEITGGHKIDIADTYGTKTFNVMDGEDGEKGETGDDYVLTSADKTEIAELAAELVEVPEPDGDYISVPGTAEVGQTIVVKAVDESGKPTEWKTVDLPSSGSEVWELIHDVTTEELTHTIQFTNLNLKKIRIDINSKVERIDETVITGDQSARFTINGAQPISNINKFSSAENFISASAWFDISSGRLFGFASRLGTGAIDANIFLKNSVSGITGEKIDTLDLNSEWTLGNVIVFSIGTNVKIYGVRCDT